jgi:hypothetical protein
MDMLEQYLDQVCRRIGGPRSLRQHVRQELREHLLDAMAGHKAAGLSEEVALARALADFGGPEEVRSELEAAHGHRLLAVVIDKAMQWKEKTMRAKWLWTTWAHLALAVVIALEVMWITFAVIFLVPRFERLLRDELIDSTILHDQGIDWMISFLQGLRTVGGGYATFWLLGAALAVGLFEWRVRSENKSLMRLSLLGTAAIGLLMAAVLTAAALVIPYQLGAPATGRLARSFALDQIATIDTSVAALEPALAKKDWPVLQGHLERASQALDNLANARPAIHALASGNPPPKVDELRMQLKSARESLLEAQQASREKGADRLQAALRKFHERYDSVEKAAKEQR